MGQIKAFQKLFLSPGFLVYGSVLIISAFVIMFHYGPRSVARVILIRFLSTDQSDDNAFMCSYGTKSMLWYIMVCSMIGGISVSVTTGLGAAIVTTAMGDNQVRNSIIVALVSLTFCE